MSTIPALDISTESPVDEKQPPKYSMLKTHERVLHVKGRGYYLRRHQGREFLGKHPRIAESRLQRIERYKKDYSLATPEAQQRFKTSLFRSVSSRARTAGQACMTLEEFGALWDRASGRCELTGVQFSVERFRQWMKRPWAPSIDRKDNSKGYEYDNCRLVCTAVNIALNEFGDEVLLIIARGMQATIDQQHATV